jgi:hypothetical protein
VAPPVFKTGLAANIVAGGFDSLPPPPLFSEAKYVLAARARGAERYQRGRFVFSSGWNQRSQRPAERILR